MRPRQPQELILEAALDVFSDYGYRKATVEDIADRLDMTKGNLYRYAKNKRELYERAVTYALLEWQGQVREAVAARSDVRDQFFTMCHAAVGYLLEDDRLRRLLQRQPEIFPAMPGDDIFGAVNRSSVELVRDLLQRGIEVGAFRALEDVGAAAEAIFSVYRLIIVRSYVYGEGEELEAMFEQLLELVARGLFA